MKRDIAPLAKACSALSRELPATAVPAANESDGNQVQFVAKGTGLAPRAPGAFR